MKCVSVYPRWPWLWLLALVFCPTLSWSSPSSTPADPLPSLTARLLLISEELVNSSDKLVMLLETQQRTVIESKQEYIESSKPLLEDLTSLSEDLVIVSTSLEESKPLLDSSETDYANSWHLMEAENRRLEVGRWVWAGWGAVAGAGVALGLVLAWTIFF